MLFIDNWTARYKLQLPKAKVYIQLPNVGRRILLCVSVTVQDSESVERGKVKLKDNLIKDFERVEAIVSKIQIQIQGIC